MSERHWQPSATIENLRKRAEIISRLRRFFYERGLLEVETPTLAWAGVTDPHLENITARYVGPAAPAGATLYLQTSPEYAMKRLLAAGSGPIFQISKVFRQGERGRRHNPEFTMLEWYRPDWDHHALMDEMDVLLTEVLAPFRSLEASERVTYQALFLRYLQLDPFEASLEQLRICAEAHGLHYYTDETDRDTWLNLLISHLIEPQLGQGRLTYVYAYPPSQAALAKIQPGPPVVASRFELYLDGVELANGFHELTDADEQRRRFEQDLNQRRRLGISDCPVDEALIAALAAGMPPCAGVALGVDRLVMRALQGNCIDEVVAFPLERA